MPIQNIARLIKASTEDGAFHHAFFHKTSVPATTAGRWMDFSMGAGIPKYNAYVGGQATATQFIGAGNDGIYLGQNPAPGKDRYLNRILVQPTSAALVPAFFMFMDYLLHYPLIDGDNTDVQEMDNTLTLPRYANGDDVQCMLVCTTPMTANAVATISYTNQDGVAGRISTSRLISTATVGTIICGTDSSAAAGRAGPFIPLDNGDKGIRSIESITLGTGTGGFFAAVLVKPLTHVQLLELGVASEIQPISQRACVIPKIEQGAFINFISQTSLSGAVTALRGELEIIHQ